MTNHPRRVFISFLLLFDPSFIHFNDLKGIYGMPVKLVLEPSGTWRFFETTADILHIIFSFQPRKAYYTHHLGWSQVCFKSFMCAWVACGNYTQCKSCTTGWIFHYLVRDSAKKKVLYLHQQCFLTFWPLSTKRCKCSLWMAPLESNWWWTLGGSQLDIKAKSSF